MAKRIMAVMRPLFFFISPNFMGGQGLKNKIKREIRWKRHNGKSGGGKKRENAQTTDPQRAPNPPLQPPPRTPKPPNRRERQREHPAINQQTRKTSPDLQRHDIDTLILTFLHGDIPVCADGNTHEADEGEVDGGCEQEDEG